MMKTALFPAPGERRTTIVVWNIDDPAKAGDARYWWDEKEVSRLRELSPDMPDLSGRPRGRSLASLQREAEDGAVELGVPELPDGTPTQSVRVSLSRWSDADPERTYLMVTHGRRPTPEEQEALSAKGFPWPEDVEALRQEWLAAVAADLPDKAAELRQQLDTASKSTASSSFENDGRGTLRGQRRYNRASSYRTTGPKRTAASFTEHLATLAHARVRRPGSIRGSTVAGRAPNDSDLISGP